MSRRGNTAAWGLIKSSDSCWSWQGDMIPAHNKRNPSPLPWGLLREEAAGRISTGDVHAREEKAAPVHWSVLFILLRRLYSAQIKTDDVQYLWHLTPGWNVRARFGCAVTVQLRSICSGIKQTGTRNTWGDSLFINSWIYTVWWLIVWRPHTPRHDGEIFFFLSPCWGGGSLRVMAVLQSTVEKTVCCRSSQADWNSGNATRRNVDKWRNESFFHVKSDQTDEKIRSLTDSQSWFALLQRHLSSCCFLFSLRHAENSWRGHFILPLGRAAKRLELISEQCKVLIASFSWWTEPCVENICDDACVFHYTHGAFTTLLIFSQLR